MSEPATPPLAYAFPVFFLSMWLPVTTLLGVMSGWFELQQRFPAGTETGLLTLRMRSGQMKRSVNMSGILTLSACRSGLRIGVLRIFGPFQRPFTVPWEQITATPRTLFLMPSVRLGLGVPEAGSLTVDARLWQRLAAYSPVAMAELPTVSIKRSGLSMLAIWAAITSIAATFYYLVSRTRGAAGMPIWFCIGFPGVFFGAVFLVHFS